MKSYLLDCVFILGSFAIFFVQDEMEQEHLPLGTSLKKDWLTIWLEWHWTIMMVIKTGWTFTKKITSL